MPRDTKGSIIERTDRPGLWARVTYVDNLGRRRVIQRKVDSRTEGKLLLKKLLREIDDHGAQILDGDRLTFRDLAKVYEEKRLFEPTITPSGKAIGLKSFKSVRRRLRTLTKYFGNKRIRNITHADIETYKRERLATIPQRETVKRAKLEERLKTLRKAPAKAEGGESLRIENEIERLAQQLTNQPAPRTEADVNRDLQLLRNVLNFAIRQGWINQNPFALGEPLISQAVEVRRERVLSRDEEERLLLACTDGRAHLRPILICALDTAMRRGEIFQLRWKDVDLFGGEITVRATTTKTGKARAVPISARLRDELTRLRAIAPDDPNERVFGIVNTIKKGFASACQAAGVEEFRFHDARHTAITRWIEQGLPPMQVMAISGHTQMQTFARYVNADKAAIRRAAEAMDDWHAMEIEPERPELVN